MMFTGIVTNQARVALLKKQGGQVRFRFQFRKREKRKIEPGESIAVNGVCLTVVKAGPGFFEADVVRQTLEATTFSRLSKGDWVHTERSLRFGDLLGGHFVTGHVDGRGKILEIKKTGKNVTWMILVPKRLLKFLAAKGSMAVDGVSLTVHAVRTDHMKVGLVPHTLRQTVFSGKKAGDVVNLEADLVARYLAVLEPLARKKISLSVDQLKKQGF